MNDTVEKYVADTVLQEPLKVNLNGKAYTVSRPSAATIIEVSKYIATLPLAPFIEGKHEVLTYVLAYAKDCEAIGHIAATLILGKRISSPQKKLLPNVSSGYTRRLKQWKWITVPGLRKSFLRNVRMRNCCPLLQALLKCSISLFFQNYNFPKRSEHTAKTKEKRIK